MAYLQYCEPDILQPWFRPGRRLFKRLHLIFAIAAYVSLCLCGMVMADENAARRFVPEPLIGGKDWKFILNEEFDGTKLDDNLWTTCYWWNDNGCTNLSNHELQWYRPENVEVSDGYLRLTARPEKVAGIENKTFAYTSGMITSGIFYSELPRKPRFEFTYGLVEVRAKMPGGKGLWPAIWMLPATRESRPEIDIMEVLGDSADTLRVHLHYSDEKKQHQQVGQNIKTKNLLDGWHVYGMKWDAKEIVWYLDGIQVWKYAVAAHIPHEPMYILLNLAVGGDYPGSPNASTRFPADFVIDYIRIWQRGRR